MGTRVMSATSAGRLRRRDRVHLQHRHVDRHVLNIASSIEKIIKSLYITDDSPRLTRDYIYGICSILRYRCTKNIEILESAGCNLEKYVRGCLKRAQTCRPDSQLVQAVSPLPCGSYANLHQDRDVRGIN